MIRIAVLTATRAEYGLMRQLIFRFNSDEDIQLSLLVTGTHLSKNFGMTINEIEADNIPVAEKIEILSEHNGVVDVAETMGNALVRFSRYFQENRFDFLLVDGDRYETLAVCIAAVNNNIPIIHCGGGATTEGANDEYWRHAITKLSYLHFPTMEIYRNRIIGMGEEPSRVFTVGSMGLENIRVMNFFTKVEIEDKLKFKLDKPYALITFHPVTLENSTCGEQIEQLLEACDLMKDMKYIFTKANADKDGYIINECLERYTKDNPETSICVSSMGAQYYLSAMKYCEFVMGNSSSGLIEAPSFGIPTINIGDRQKGREQAKSIINCEPKCENILQAMKVARSQEYRMFCKEVVNPNGDGYTSERIVKHIKDIFYAGNYSMEKRFYDVKFESE